MIRYRLAQSNAWVYSIQKTTEGPGTHALAVLRREAEIELQAWIIKMDPDREFVPSVDAICIYDYRNRVWRIDASWLSPNQLHEEGETP